jgi:hypothetical protein
MNHKIALLVVLFLGKISLSFSQSHASKSLKTFPLESVTLLESPFKNAREVDLKYILELNPDRLLAPYLLDAGLPTKAERYGNWERSGLDGHIAGHYLSALANMYASTGHQEIRNRLNYMVNELVACQTKNGNGYTGGIPNGKIFWERIRKGDIEGSSFGLNNTWVPLYNLHKLLAGLRDAYLIGGNTTALEVWTKLTDWLNATFESLSDEQTQQVLKTEHGGINEVCADLYAITHNEKYLILAKKLSHTVLLDQLEKSEDKLTGLHANTQIPKVVGFERISELTQNVEWHKAALFFWENVVFKRSISFGGNSVREHFNSTDDFLPMLETSQGPETCNTYNMLRLTKALFRANPDVKYLDYYEKALYNHILSSQHPQKGGFVYFTPIRPRHYRVYSQPQQGFWCCVGTGLENHGKYGELIYAHSDNELYVNFFIPSVLNWKEKGIRITQNTQFPFEETTKLTIEGKKKTKFVLKVRYPGWVKEKELKVSINGQPYQITAKPASFIEINRIWKNGDIIEIKLPMHNTLEYLPNNKQWASVLHGPILMASVTDTTDLKGLWADDSRMGHVASGKMYPMDEAPLLSDNDKNYLEKIEPVQDKPLHFSLKKLAYPEQYQQLQLIPFFQVHEARYIIYWYLSTTEEAKQRNEALKKKEEEKLKLESRTLDMVFSGEQQPEVEHHFKGENTVSGEENGVFWRSSKAWFSYELSDKNSEAKKLRVYTNHSNTPEKFQIFLNDVLLKSDSTIELSDKKTFYIEYPVAQNGVFLMVLKIVAKGENTGKISEIRLLK